MKSFEDFKNALGQQESGNNYNSVNKYGYTGRYQFGSTRLKELGYTGTMTNFKNSPDLQEQYFIIHVQNHAKNLISILITAKSKYGDGVTLSGIIAGAHLVGAGGVRNYILKGIDKKDGNGVKCSYYVNTFSGYEIPNYPEDQIDKKKMTEFLDKPGITRAPWLADAHKAISSTAGTDSTKIDFTKILIVGAAAVGVTVLMTSK